MVLIALSLVFWFFSLAVLFRMCRASDLCATPRRVLPWLFLLLAAGILFMRPHEDIFGGQDDGAYLAYGARIGREQQLVYIDPLLKHVPDADRAGFLYYGPGRPYWSQFACGRVRDLARAECGPWFQPAFPIAAGLFTLLGGPRAALYVIPIFACFTALALACLARKLIPHSWAAALAFAFYILTPLTVWHARAPRPEIISSFLTISGAVLLLDAWKRRQDEWVAVLLGGTAISLAPFFHITGWMLAVPAAALVAVAILAGRPLFLLYIIPAAIGLSGFILQTMTLVDTYSLRRFFEPVVAQGWRSVAAAAAAAGLLVVLCLKRRRRKGRSSLQTFLDRPLGIYLAASAVVLVYLAVFAVSMKTRPSKMDAELHYFFRTDLKTVINMISAPVGILALLGLAVLAAQPGRTHRQRIAFLLYAAPATLLIGNMYDFFMTRYMLVALVPLMSLGLTALLCLIPAYGSAPRQGSPGGRRRFVPQLLLGAAALSVCVLLWRERTHLVRTTEYKGFADYIGRFADEIRADDGILLAEYSRIAAPFDHFFGVDTLGLHNERIRDYRPLERAWRAVMRALPDRPAFFLTPFPHPPLSSRFCFELVRRESYEGRRLLEHRWALPRRVVSWGTTLHLYRVHLRDQSRDPSCAVGFPHRVELDDGNMGVYDFANLHVFDVSVRAWTITPRRPLRLTLPAAPDATSPLWLFCFNADEREAPALDVRLEGARCETSATRLVGSWWLLTVRIADGQAGSLEISSKRETAVTSVQRAVGRQVESLFEAWRQDGSELIPVGPVQCRWARQGSSILLPRPEGGGYICGFLVAPEEVGDRIVLSMSAGGGADSGVPPQAEPIPTGRWIWKVWPLQHGKDQPGALARYTIKSSHPFDPRNIRYPSNLAAIFAWFVVIESDDIQEVPPLETRPDK